MSGSRKLCLSPLAIAFIVLTVLVAITAVTLLILHFHPRKRGAHPQMPEHEIANPMINVMGEQTRSRSLYGYLIGVGRADCTGPVAELPFMGYANGDQTGAGVLSRLYSRAFIIAEPNDKNKRVVFVTAELGMLSQRVKLEVTKQLEHRYGDLYRHDNVILSATHTHSGPGGYFQYMLFALPCKGFIQPSLDAVVSGIIKSIEIAHQNMKKGRLFINKGLLHNSNINRSPFSYEHNPESEKLRYSSNTDKEMVVLKMTDDSGQEEIGLFSWFPVHPVSMNNTNRLTSSDNLGYASYLLEQEKNKGYLTGEGPYVAGFGSSNLGDVSPNTKGPHCINTGESCDNFNNYCPVGGAKMCIASGPGRDMLMSTQIIGRNLYLKAKELSISASEEITGPLSAAHQWVNMSNITVPLNATHSGKTCKPAMGYSFAAGTMDGPGMFNFTQGAVQGDPFWDIIRDMFLTRPSNEIVECQKPKPILIPTGELSKPSSWHPEIIDVQIVTIGSVAIVALPGEFTTMAGRRIREAIKNEFEVQGKPGMNIILAGLCNVYTHYITTYEEYQVQRYEGASTIFGPHTLSAYIQTFRTLAKAIAKDTISELIKNPKPPIINITLNLLPFVMDSKPLGSQYGDVLQDVQPTYRVGDVANVQFIGANPRNSIQNMNNFTFLEVKKYDNASQSWQLLYNDASWDTRFKWEKGYIGNSIAILEWHIPNHTEPGSYRLQYFGHSKELLGSIHAFNGTSSVFEVLD